METIANQPIKTNRELAMERMSARHPDKDFSGDEALYGQYVEELAQSDDEIAKYKERERALSDMITADPRAAQILVDMRDGKDVAVSLVRMFGNEIKDAIDDPDMQEAMAEANKEFVERVAKEKEYEEMYKANLAQSLSDLDAIQNEMGLSDEDAENALMFLHTISAEGVMGKFTPDNIRMALKAMNHDADVAQAAHEGEVKGRNIKIDEKLRTKKKGDGTAALDGKNGAVAPKRTMPSLGALDKFEDGETIWDRGMKK